MVLYDRFSDPFWKLTCPSTPRHDILHIVVQSSQSLLSDNRFASQRIFHVPKEYYFRASTAQGHQQDQQQDLPASHDLSQVLPIHAYPVSWHQAWLYSKAIFWNGIPSRLLDPWYLRCSWIEMLRHQRAIRWYNWHHSKEKLLCNLE
jgi:hypothetical protein